MRLTVVLMVPKLGLDVVRVLVSMPRALRVIRRVPRPMKREIIVMYYEAGRCLDEVYVNITEAAMVSD